MFRALASEEFPPFGAFRLDLPPVENKPDDLAEVHLFTGVNGTGKTRLLAILAAALGGDGPLIRRLRGVEKYLTVRIADDDTLRSDVSKWGSLAMNQDETAWAVGGANIWENTLNIPAFAYNGIAYISDDKFDPLVRVTRPEREACLRFSRHENSSGALLQGIASLKIQAAIETQDAAHGSKAPTRSTVLARALEKAVSDITKRSFAFKVATHPKPSLRVLWGGESLPFDVLPDGLRSIIGWLADAIIMMDAWLGGASDPFQTESVFLLDEIESHLHPAWQRRLLPAFQRLFPKAQIFVATHSPFVIASLNHGWIHRLTLDDDGVARIQPPQPASAGDSYVSVVEDILGLKEQFDPESEELLAKFRAARDSAYQGNLAAKVEARDLAQKIGARSMELGYIMSHELSQMDRQLTRVAEE